MMMVLPARVYHTLRRVPEKQEDHINEQKGSYFYEGGVLQGYLIKPFQTQQLLEAIQAYLSLTASYEKERGVILI